MSLARRLIENVIMVRGTREDAMTRVVDFKTAEDQKDFCEFLQTKNVDYWTSRSGTSNGFQVYFQAPQSGASNILNSLDRFNGKLDYSQQDDEDDVGGRNSTTLPPTTPGGW